MDGTTTPRQRARGDARRRAGERWARSDARGTRFGRTRVGDPRRASPRVGWRRATTGRTRRTGAPGRARKPAPAAAAAAHALDIVPEGQPNEEGASRGRFGPSRRRVSGTLRPEPPPRTPRTTRASPPRFARRGVDLEPPLGAVLVRVPRNDRPEAPLDEKTREKKKVRFDPGEGARSEFVDFVRNSFAVAFRQPRARAPRRRSNIDGPSTLFYRTPTSASARSDGASKTLARAGARTRDASPRVSSRCRRRRRRSHASRVALRFPSLFWSLVAERGALALRRDVRFRF